MKSDFIDAFIAVKNSREAPCRFWEGFKVLLKLAGWCLIPALLWEFTTTFIAYLPASDFHFWICRIVDRKWGEIHDGDRQKVLSLLLWLDKSGEISAILSKTNGNGDVI